MTASTVDATARVSEPGRAPRRTALRRFRLDFTFDDEAFELKSGEEDIGENVVVGGANRWAYNTFVNYETFPKGWDRCGNHPVISVIAWTFVNLHAIEATRSRRQRRVDGVEPPRHRADAATETTSRR